jgi:hypothetical protein
MLPNVNTIIRAYITVGQVRHGLMEELGHGFGCWTTIGGFLTTYSGAGLSAWKWGCWSGSS